MALQHERMTEFDPDSSTPMWRQIYAILRGRILDGTYAPGRLLPSIAYIEQEYGVARGTARRSLDALIDDGYAYTEPGKGTYVTRGVFPGPGARTAHGDDEGRSPEEETGL